MVTFGPSVCKAATQASPAPVRVGVQPRFHPQYSTKAHSRDSCGTPSWCLRMARCKEKPVTGPVCLTAVRVLVWGQHL